MKSCTAQKDILCDLSYTWNLKKVDLVEAESRKLIMRLESGVRGAVWGKGRC